MGEPGRFHAVGEWWQGLSQAWRANVVLYGLATISLLALVAQIVAGGGDQPGRVEVASGVAKGPPTTMRTLVPAPTTTAAPGAPVAPDTNTSLPPSPQAPDRPASPTPISVDPTTPPQDTAVAPPPPCLNSTEPRCGDFFWLPGPGENQPLTVVVSTSQPVAGQPVDFTVTVTDPDHAVTLNCAVIEYGDGAVDRPGCNPVPCPALHGPWETPAKQTGRETFNFRHRYQAGNWQARFTFRTDADRCPDPYGSQGTGQATVSQPGS